LLGIDLIVASHPALLVKALSVRRDGAPVLVDLPGGCGFEGTHRDEMSDLAGCVGGRLALVLPAGLDPVEAAETAAAHLDIGAAYLVVTRTDVARRLGCVLAAAAGGMALSEAGIGPGAVDGLIPLTPDWLAGRLLGHPMGRGA
jgi:flagellar biosynthesis protein FlhF